MNKIKLRAWDKAHKRMVKIRTAYFRANPTEYTVFTDVYTAGYRLTEDNIILYQCIAKDRDDNDKYIGSRVKLFDVPSDARDGIVVYDEEEAMFRVDVGTEEYCPLIPREVEVIGTIHDKEPS